MLILFKNLDFTTLNLLVESNLTPSTSHIENITSELASHPSKHPHQWKAVLSITYYKQTVDNFPI